MLRLILRLPFGVTVVLRDRFIDVQEAWAKWKTAGLPSGFEVVEDAEAKGAIEVPLKLPKEN